MRIRAPTNVRQSYKKVYVSLQATTCRNRFLLYCTTVKQRLAARSSLKKIKNKKRTGTYGNITFDYLRYAGKIPKSPESSSLVDTQLTHERYDSQRLLIGEMFKIVTTKFIALLTVDVGGGLSGAGEVPTVVLWDGASARVKGIATSARPFMAG